MCPLPFMDEHALTMPVGRDPAWQATLRYATAMTRADHPALSRLLGSHPASGFELVETRAHRTIALAGRHRFATYRLVFRLTPQGTATRVSADTFARFPGRAGRLYRALLLGTRGHQIATRRMLREIRRRAG